MIDIVCTCGTETTTDEFAFMDGETCEICNTVCVVVAHYHGNARFAGKVNDQRCAVCTAGTPKPRTLRARHCAFCKSTKGAITAYNTSALNAAGGDGAGYAHPKCFSRAQEHAYDMRHCPDCGLSLDIDHAGCKGVARDDHNGGWKRIA